MTRCDDDRATQAADLEAQRKDELALVHEVFAEEHEAAAESLSGDLAEAHRGAAEKHEQAARADRAQAQYAREEADELSHDDNSPSLVSGDVNAGRRQSVTTAEQPPPEGDEQPPQATEDDEDSNAQSREDDDLNR